MGGPTLRTGLGLACTLCGLLLSEACSEPDQLWIGLPEGASSASTALLAVSGQVDAAEPLDPLAIELFLSAEPPSDRFDFAASSDERFALELALFDDTPAALGLGSTIDTVAAESPNAAPLPLGRARRFFRNRLMAAHAGAWEEALDGPPPLLAASLVTMVPEECGAIAVDPVELRLASGVLDDSGVLFVSRLGAGVALIGTASAAYRLTSAGKGTARVEIDAALTARIQAGAHYTASFVSDDTRVWLGGKQGALDRYDPTLGTIETVTASAVDLPIWRRIEGSPDGSEMFAIGTMNNGTHEVILAELSFPSGGLARWSPTVLGISEGSFRSVDIAYEGPRQALVTRASTTLLRYRAGALESVPTAWEDAVYYSLARSSSGMLIEGSVGEGDALFGLLTPEDDFRELGHFPFVEAYEIRPMGHGFAFTGRSGWIGFVGSADSRPLLCARRVDDGAQSKPAMDILDSDSFLVGGDRSESEPATAYLVHLPREP